MMRLPFLHRLMAADPLVPAVRDAADDRWYGPVGRRTAAGVTVTVGRARQVPVIRDCLWVLASSIAGLAQGLFERGADDSRRRAPEHPVARLLRDPNPASTGFDFMASLVDDLATEGNFYAREVWLPGGRAPAELWRIDPAHVSVETLPDRSYRLVVNEPGRAREVLVEGEFWHIALPPRIGPLLGRSPIRDDGREAIGAAIALQDYANSFFGNDATPPFLFKHSGSFADGDSKANFLSAWRKFFSGRNRHTPGVLEYGMDIARLGTTNEEAQFLDTRKELWLDCTRLWRIPPHKVGILDNATFSNIEHQALEFVSDTLGPWLALIERSVNKHLVADDRYYFEFNTASLLKGDVQARYEAYAVARQWGWLSVNEIRRLENLNAIGAGGDRYIEPLNMAPVGTPPGAAQEAIAFLRASVARSGGRPNLKVIRDAA